MDIEQYRDNEEQNSSASQTSKKKKRGPTTGKKYKTQEPKFLEWSDNGKPIGKWVNSYRAYVGNLCRCKIDINIKSWDGVCQGLKDSIWEDVKTEYHIDDKMRDAVLRNACERWKDFKSRLVGGWITKTRKLPDDCKEPYEYYDGVTQAQWETFKKNCETEAFKQLSEKGRKNRACNEHPHYLGQSGYAGKKAKWIAEGHNSTTTLPSGPIWDRSVDWVLARSKKGADGNYTIPNEKTKIIADKINDWREKAIEGTWIPYRHDDVLTRALEKKEHPGRVRGVGGTAGIKSVFGKGERNKGPSGVISADDLFLITQELKANMTQELEAKMTEELEAKVSQNFDAMVDAKVEQKMADILNRMGMHMPHDMIVDNAPSVGRRSSCQSVQPDKPQYAHKSQETDPDKAQYADKSQETDPFANLQIPTKCRLAVNLKSKIVVVASGIVHPASKTCHNQQILPDHVKVGVDSVEGIHARISLPVPDKHLSMIEEALGSFVQWPKNLVLLGDDNTAAPIMSKNKVEECVVKTMNKSKKVMDKIRNESSKHKTIVDEEILKNLTGKCKYFHDLIVQAPSEVNVVNAIQVKKDLFTYNEDFEIHITMTDITQFLSMTWLNESWLQIYIMWLDHMCNDLEVETIGFLCPHKLSQVQELPDATNTYITETWRALQSKKLILAPYYEGKHCRLLVFHIENNMVYVLDPQADHKRRLEIKPQVSLAFKAYRVVGGKSRGTFLKWLNVKCPQQSGSTDCVYYVMRYMHEIVNNHRKNIDLTKYFEQVGSYSQKEINEIRDNLADYIMQNWM